MMTQVSGSTRNKGSDQVRCTCGRLVARVVDGMVEIKCRRCGELVALPLADLERGPQAIELCSPR